ncbi:uncharacterized protein LOC111075664 [Drosophila obscura]|uniref:uncharacterized protein LOC111075664 n=1 Tax=Drosophila obscura TaxID=7282 RepID=UPI001BB29651|nr:uncharacterized protein LOC111075664 [Drosophila obscura]
MDSKGLLAATSPRRLRTASASGTTPTQKIKSPVTPRAASSSPAARTKSVLFPSPVTLKVPARIQDDPTSSFGNSPVSSRPSITMAQPATTTARAKLAAAIGRLSHLEARITSAPSASLSEVRRGQILSMWADVEAEYKACSAVMVDEDPRVQEDIREKYGECYGVFEQCLADLNAQLAQTAVHPSAPQTYQGGCRLPSCDIEVFAGDYINILLFLPRVESETSRALKELQSTMQGVLTALAHSKVCTDNWDSLLVTICASKLPKLTRPLWEARVTDKKEVPPCTEIDAFLTQRYLTLEAMESDHFQRQSDPTIVQSAAFRKQLQSVPVSWQLCLNCFARGHQLRECQSAHSCFTCGARHHTLLHRGTPAPSELTSTTAEDPASSVAPPNVQNYFASGTRAVLLGTAIINICHRGTNFRARALIDSGSEATFLTERLFNITQLPFRLIQAQVSGLNQTVAAQSKKLCDLSIRSLITPSVQLNATAHVLPDIAGNLPSYPIPQSALRDLPNLPLADPKFYESSQIDVLIGADILPSILLSGSQTDICGSLLGQQTIFGWVLTGPVPSAVPDQIASFSTQISHVRDAPLDKLLTKFWEVEDLPIKVAGESDSYCERNFLRTTSRTSSGKYVVTLPFRDPDHCGSGLGHSRSIALAQFLRNENRLKRNVSFREQYNYVIQEYLDLDHMTEVPSTNESANYYLPHHAVIKPESTTTKVRVVFNASSPSANGTSLNDLLHAGPVLQSDLTLQILKWRYFRYVFNADITKMYRQIWVHPSCTPFQRILFRNQEGEIRDYELKTVTFGVNCAPFLAIRVLQQLADDIQSRFPKASHIVRHFMYVDDFLAGADSIKEASGNRCREHGKDPRSSLEGGVRRVLLCSSRVHA